MYNYSTHWYFLSKSINFPSSIKTLNCLSIRYLYKLQYLCARNLKTKKLIYAEK
jgi:hypothetical protein